MLLLFVPEQFWIRVPLMAPEDTQEELIENEPSKCTDDASVDEKTWTWLVQCQYTTFHRQAEHRLHTNIDVIDFLYNPDTSCSLAFPILGGTHSELFVTTTRGSV